MKPLISLIQLGVALAASVSISYAAMAPPRVSPKATEGPDVRMTTCSPPVYGVEGPETR